LYKVDDGLAATNGLHNFRIVTLTADADQLHRTVNLMSNGRIGCTVIYDESEIYYDISLRLKGSEHSRTNDPRLGFNVAFASQQPFAASIAPWLSTAPRARASGSGRC